MCLRPASSIASDRATSEHRIDRISQHALELTKLDYDLREKALESTGGTQRFLAPAKAYRILYRALRKLHDQDDWPQDVEKEGLLSVFDVAHDRDRCEERVREFYQPLLNMLEEGTGATYYDPDSNIYPPIFDFMKAKRLFATNELWAAYLDFRAKYESVTSVGRDDKLQFYRAAYRDMGALVTRLGYGTL